MKCQIPALLDRGGGVIVNVASESPFKGNAGDLDYTASKHGVVGLTTAAALQNATRNINGVSPAMSMQALWNGHVVIAARPSCAVSKEPGPSEGFSLPEEIAGIVVWLCADSAVLIDSAKIAADTGWYVP
ncbi:SDR family NAD(P)-dependent oxidoreductase [Mycobacterium sp. MUNTM1]